MRHGPARGVAGLAWIALIAAIGGCAPAERATISYSASKPATVADVTKPDNAFAEPQTPDAHKGSPAGTVRRMDIVLRVLHVQVPSTERSQTDAVWQQLREDVCDSETLQRLHDNGVRVGVGRTERWDAVRAAFDTIEGNRVRDLPPLRTPPGTPLALELDLKPQDQTIFYLAPDGILTGDTWPASQRVLRVMYALDASDLSHVVLSIVPEVRRREAAELDYTEGAWTTGPRRAGRSFAAAACAVTLGPNEYVVVAPGDRADVTGLVGATFLKQQINGVFYDSYVFVRADVKYVNEHR